MPHQTYKYISLQHELGMAIGLDLNLSNMLQQFTKVSIRQLGLTSVNVYFLHDDKNDIVLKKADDTFMKHFLSVPERNSVRPSYQLPDIDLDTTDSECIFVQVFDKKENEHIYYYSLGKFGWIAFHRYANAINENFLKLLLPIINRLTISCQASIEHDHLLYAIQSRIEVEQAIRFKAFHDDLTQLPNRHMLMENLAKDLARCKRHKLLGAILFLDLNRFKAINDTLGHAVGDQLLIKVGDILKQITRKEDTVARLSGDEFVIQLCNIKPGEENGKEAVKTILGKIHKAFSDALKVGDHTLHVTPSIGVEIYPLNDEGADQILHHADIAMYQAKTQGPNSSMFYNSKLSSGYKMRLELEKELQIAIETMHQFQLYYQPQFNSWGECVGAEALLRWNNPDRGFVSPSIFIPIAEKTGIMLKLGNWVIEQACRDLAVLDKQGIPATFEKCSVNVSAIQFGQENFTTNLLAILTTHNIRPGLFGVELTESTLIKNIEDTITIIDELKDAGIDTSIDDFGTGYSSLAYLTRFSIKTLKIDQIFVRNIDTSSANRAVVDTIMVLGTNLKLSIIAEGIETEAELKCLREFNCEFYQGYYFSKPVPFKDLQLLLEGIKNEKQGDYLEADIEADPTAIEQANQLTHEYSNLARAIS
ncbi:MAG: bifunctional diguanylate cyclase/phosphodiesterase [Pseudomonadota bacterium]